MKQTLEAILKDHPFVKDLNPKHLHLLIGCAANIRIEQGKYLFKENQPAENFFFIRKGQIAIESFIPGKGQITIQTVDDGDILGWSWLIPPYKWHFDAKATTPVRAITLDAKCLRTKCEKDFELGYEMMKRVAYLMENRLQATRLQLLDFYGN
ncbi:MAG: cyclic nucleotide-binding domain-containing protein [Bacteroidota bacterium]